MNFKRLKAIAGKEFIHIARDPRSLGFALIVPVFLMFIYGYALSLDIDHIPTAVIDYNKTKISLDFIDKFKNSKYFKINYVNNYQELFKLINQGICQEGIIIPADFTKRIKNGDSASVQIILDGSDPNLATTAIGYTRAINEIFSQELLNNNLTIPIDPQIRIWFNPQLKSKNFIIPGLIAMIMAILASLLTSLTISREWENGTMELLISTPIKSQEIILGKLIPYFFIGFIDAMTIVLIGRLIFQVPLKGSLPLLLIVTSIFLVGVLTYGIMISIITKNQMLSTQIAFMSTYLPIMILSGFIYPIYNMPHILQFLTYIVPARYFITCLKAIYLKAIGIESIYLEVILLIAFSFVVLTISNKKFTKKLF